MTRFPDGPRWRRLDEPAESAAEWETTMRQHSIGKALMLAALSSAVPAAHAGPLRDWLMQRAQQKQGDNELDGDRNGLTARGPFPLPQGVELIRDVAYGSAPVQKIDVYRPTNATNAPVIFMVHGGGWRHGDKDLLRVVKNKVDYFVPKGYIFISVGYTLLPDANPLQQADQVGKALAFAQQKARSWGGDPSRFVLMGHSAGAHLVSLISADPSIATSQGAQRWLGTVSLDSAGYDVVKVMEGHHYRLYDQAFHDDPAFWREASPFWRLKSAPAPMLLVCSTKRDDSCDQAKAFAAKIQSLNGKAQVLPMDFSHADINDLLGAPGPYTTSVEAFLHGTLGLP
jgi:acetyl esterase/lipase